MWKKGWKMVGILALSLALITGCSSNDPGGEAGNDGDGSNLSGEIKIDGSSTVYPLTQAVAEEFMAANPGVNITVAQSGTGGGFEKWTKEETDLNDASRPIKDEEIEAAQEAGLEPIEIPVAFDGVTVVVNKENDFVDELTIDELKKIWEPDSKVKTWKDVRSEWPDEEIKLYGPGTASGTFGYFTEATVGEEGSSRTDYTQSEDDNVLVQGVIGDKYSLGYFGYAYYVENKDEMKAVNIDAGDGAIEPTAETIEDGSYSPLSRPIYVYASNKALENEAIQEFLKFYLTEGKALIPEVGYITMPDEEYDNGLKLIGE